VIVWSALALGVFAVAVLGFSPQRRSRWAVATHALLGELEAARLPARASRCDLRELGDRLLKHQDCSGMGMPLNGEAACLLPGVRKPDRRGTITPAQCRHCPTEL
jgi:hypothetical protein